MVPLTTQLLNSILQLGPAILLILGGCLVFAGPLLTGRGTPRDDSARRSGYGAVTLALMIAAFAWHWIRLTPERELFAFGLFTWDRTAVAAERLAFLGGIVLTLIGWSTAPRLYLAEFFGGLLIAIGATALVGACNDLVSLFLALELISIPTYVMLGTVRGEDASLESAIKYFLLSAMASALFLFGASYLYGTAGTTDLRVVTQAISVADANPLPMLGILLMIAGLTFRITAVPFHFYGPDVFEGTGISMAAMMSYVPKAAGFLALVRLLEPIPASSYIGSRLIPILLILAVLTFTVGNMLAAAQQNLRRLLGYSSVAHSGYLLVALATMMLVRPQVDVLFVYLLVYAMMTLGFFAFLAEVEAAGGRTLLISDLSGMFYRRPAASVAAVICLISLIGLPPTAGLWAKFQIIAAGVSADRWDYLIAVLLLAINAAVAAAYYWRILQKMFDRSANLPPLRLWRPSLFLAYSICAALTLIWFFVPSGI